MLKKRMICCLWALFVLLFIGPYPVYGETVVAVAQVVDATGQQVGKISFTEKETGGVTIQVDVHSLPPGVHAFHIHEKALCEPPDFVSAGGHFNPTKKEHGFLNRKGHHAGDLPNITVEANGKCHVSFETDQISVSKGATHSLIRDEGTSVVIHEKPDDYFTDPVGCAGKRIACGVIVRE